MSQQPRTTPPTRNMIRLVRLTRLLPCWFAGSLGVTFAVLRQPRCAVLGFVISLVFYLTPSVAATIFVPPRKPLSESSALAERARTLVSTAWKALLFTLAGIYGAVFAIDADAQIKESAPYSPAFDRLVYKNLLEIPEITVIIYSFFWSVSVWWRLRAPSAQERERSIRKTAIVGARWITRHGFGHPRKASIDFATLVLRESFNPMPIAIGLWLLVALSGEMLAFVITGQTF